MQIQILAASPTEKVKLTVAELQRGQAPIKYTVGPGEKITVIVDGVTLTGSQTIANRKLKLIKSGSNLIIQVDDEDLIELHDFYTESDALLVGDQWSLADGSQLQQLDEGVAVFQQSGAAVAELAIAELAVAKMGLGSILGIAAAAPLAIAATAGDKGSNNQMSNGGGQPAAPTVDVKTENTIQPVVTGTATLQSGDRLTVTVNGATYNNVPVDNTGHWSINTATAIPSSGSLGLFVNGQSYSVVATVSNAIGNASDASNNEITIVTSVAVPVLNLFDDSGRSGSDLVTSNGTVLVSNLVVGATWQYSLDGGTTWTPGNGGAVASSTTSSFMAPQGVFDAGSILAKQTIGSNTSSIGELISTSTQAQGLLYNMEAGYNFTPQITALSDGGYVVAWRGQVFEESGLSFEIFTQRYDSSNRALGTPQALVGQSIGQADNVRLSATVDAGYVAVWNEYTPGSGTSVYFQSFDAQNTAMGPAQSLLANSFPLQNSTNLPRVVALENGGNYAGSVLVWTDESSEVFVQGIDINGQLMGVPTSVGAAGHNDKLDITALQNGGYVITKANPMFGGTVIVPSAAIFDNNHAYVTEITTVQTQTGLTTVHALSDGGFVMAYQSNNDIYYLRSDAAGNLTSGPTALNRPHHSDRPNIAVLPNGDYVLSWIEETFDNQSFDIFTQLIDGVTNSPSSSVVRLQGESGNITDSPARAISMDNGDYVVVWGGGLVGDLFSQLFDSTGAPQGGVNNLTAINGNNVLLGDLTELDDGGYAITGHRYNPSSNSYDVLVMRFDANHQPVDETIALTIDQTGPSLVTSSPLDDAQDYGGDSNLTLFYNERVVLGNSGNVIIKDLMDNSEIIIDLANPQGQVQTLDNRLIIDPIANLSPGRHYSLLLDAGVVNDMAGNPNAAITDDSVLDFTIGLPTTLDLGLDIGSGIDLKLIGGFKTNDNKWYYYLDLTNDGSSSDNLDDQVSHDALDALLNGGSDTIDTQPSGAVAGIDDARTVIINGYTLVLPTADELLPVLTALNPTSPFWSVVDPYWTSTTSAAEEHITLSAIPQTNFIASSAQDPWLNSVAFQVII